MSKMKDMLIGNVEYLNKEMERGKVYPHTAEFCYWLLENSAYWLFTEAQLRRLVDYVGEAEHQDDNIPKENWEHLVHFELNTVHTCLVCLTKWDELLEDYSYCCR